MIIFEVKIFLRRIVGLGSFSGKYYRETNIVVPIMVAIPLLFLASTSILNIILSNEADLNEAWFSIPGGGGASYLTSVYLHFLFNRNRFISLLDEMENIVNESE